MEKTKFNNGNKSGLQMAQRCEKRDLCLSAVTTGWIYSHCTGNLGPSLHWKVWLTSCVSHGVDSDLRCFLSDFFS